MNGEELVAGFLFIPSDAKGYEVEESCYTEGRNWLIERELIGRGEDVRAVLTRHSEDNSDYVYAGPSHAVWQRGRICQNLLKLLDMRAAGQGEEGWHMALSDVDREIAQYWEGVGAQ